MPQRAPPHNLHTFSIASPRVPLVCRVARGREVAKWRWMPMNDRGVQRLFRCPVERRWSPRPFGEWRRSGCDLPCARRRVSGHEAEITLGCCARNRASRNSCARGSAFLTTCCPRARSGRRYPVSGQGVRRDLVRAQGRGRGLLSHTCLGPLMVGHQRGCMGARRSLATLGAAKPLWIESSTAAGKSASFQKTNPQGE